MMKPSATSLVTLPTAKGFEVRRHETAVGLLDAVDPSDADCLLTDVRMPGMSGLELLAELRERRMALPAIVMTAFGDIDMAVAAMKKDAVDFLVKPVDGDRLVASLRAACSRGNGARGGASQIEAARNRLDCLSARERAVLAGLVKGKLNKTIAHDLGISQRTVETHRARLTRKAHASTMAELVHMALLADFSPS